MDKRTRATNLDDKSQLLEWQIHNKREWQILRCPTGIRSCWKRAVYRLLANDRHHFPVLFFSFVLLKQLCLLLQSFSSSLSVDTFPLFINFILVYMIVCMHICWTRHIVSVILIVSIYKDIDNAVGWWWIFKRNYGATVIMMMNSKETIMQPWIWGRFARMHKQRCKKRQIWQIYLCYSFQYLYLTKHDSVIMLFIPQKFLYDVRINLWAFIDVSLCNVYGQRSLFCYML